MKEHPTGYSCHLNVCMGAALCSPVSDTPQQMMLVFGLERGIQKYINSSERFEVVVNMNSSDVFKELDVLFERCLRLRAYFPYMNKEMIGRTTFQTAPIYSKALDMRIDFTSN